MVSTSILARSCSPLTFFTRCPQGKRESRQADKGWRKETGELRPIPN